nr:uncharacterized protein LOC129167760 [Nothobranchius furzeri]
MRWVADRFDIEDLKAVSFWDFAALLLRTFGRDPPPPVADATSASQMVSQMEYTTTPSPGSDSATTSSPVGCITSSAPVEVTPAPPRSRAHRRRQRHHQHSTEARVVPPISEAPTRRPASEQTLPRPRAPKQTLPRPRAPKQTLPRPRAPKQTLPRPRALKQTVLPRPRAPKQTAPPPALKQTRPALKPTSPPPALKQTRPALKPTSPPPALKRTSLSQVSPHVFQFPKPQVFPSRVFKSPSLPSHKPPSL